MRVSIRRRSDAVRRNDHLKLVQVEPGLDKRGHPRRAVTLPGHKQGEHPPNYGKSYPAEVLTPAEVGRLMRACGKGPGGVRNRALIVVMWRCGLRCAEALNLELRDVDRDAGTIAVRHGKGDKRRIVPMDAPPFEVLERWLDVRRELGVPRGSKVFCSITRPGVGQPMSASYWRAAIKKLGVRAGLEKRVHSHGLRHTCAAEMHREGVPVGIIQQLLGHSDLKMTAWYVNHLEPAELIRAVHHRPWPLHEAA